MRLISVGAPSRQLPAIVSYSMNTGFILMLVWPILPITWSFCKVSNEHQSVQKALKPIIDHLMSSATKYSSVDYNLMNLITILLPAQQNLKHLEFIASNVRTGIACYLASCIPIIYTHLYFIYLSSFYWSLPIQQNRIKNKPDLSSYLPILTFLASLSFSGDAFLIDSRWWTGMELGLTIPFTIVANINLYIMYKNIRYSTLIISTNHTRDPQDKQNPRLPLNVLVEEV
ncbi:hypothetical protein DFH28DRAFT_228903 [Melampsora americana]|nr:hypothetical protein DFH28DRAFT_228903 [Melampsora americana]